MEWKMNPNAVNQFTKGSTIYTQEDPVFSIGMIIKGRVMIHNNGAKIVVGSGSFLGINDLYHGKYLSDYTAVDDLLLFVFPINRVEELDTILSANKDYHGFMVASFYKMIYELDQIYKGMIKYSAALFQFLTDYYKRYTAMAVRKGTKQPVSERICRLELIDSDLELLIDRVNYYIECRSLPIDVVKTFYSYGNAITMYQIEDQVNVVNQQLISLKEMAQELVTMAECLVDESDSCLFQLIAAFSISMDNSSGTSNEVMEIMDDIIEQVNQTENFVERMLGIRYKVNRKKMEDVYHLLLTTNRDESVSTASLLKYSKEDTQHALEEMKDAFAKILDYSGIESGRAKEMKDLMQDFVHMKDKFTTDDTGRILRKKLGENHYEIYLPVFLRAYKEKTPPRLIDLFLKYGFADDRLLTNDQMLSLYYLQEDEAKQSLCNVYDIKSWLTMIYEGKKEPSKNEFDLEYPEHLAGLRKQNQLTEKEVALWLSDPLKKLQYEIQNMFRYNNRTTNGQITSFIPFLYKEQWTNGIEKIMITRTKLNEAIAGIICIDYSVFDREIIYTNKEKNIVKEYIVKRVFPDVILLPNVGNNGVMWQEIAGKKRDTPARFLLPAFSDVNLGLLLIRILGRFRWELCRTIEGISWNDIQNKSLTSEYGDFLQFYRKNKDLSEEKKERIKNQIQKGRNSSREIFVLDYELWINYEARGALKLNKPVREIMATYCPFAKEIREKIKMQPLFEDAMARYYKEKQRKVREIEGRHRLLQKENIEIVQELLDTLYYYRDM